MRPKYLGARVGLALYARQWSMERGMMQPTREMVSSTMMARNHVDWKTSKSCSLSYMGPVVGLALR